VGFASLLAAAPAFGQDSEAMETVTVTGYRASLTDSTNAKRAAIGFSDTVFAEDVGKFPDSNIAEALNRIPGINITREINGDGMQVSIRGLGTNFTKILVNGNPVSVATMGPTDATNSNREVDLNMFPSELFTQLSVQKSPTADMEEGGAAGSVNMRPMRPFDNPGLHFNYNVQLTDQSTTNMAIGKRGSLVFSDTSGPFGILVGITGVQSNIHVTGWEDGNTGWFGPNLPTGVCTASSSTNTCGQFGSQTWTIQSSVVNGTKVPIPTGYTLGLTAADIASGYLPTGYSLTGLQGQKLLYALNPDLADSSCDDTNPSATCLSQMSTRLSNALVAKIPRVMRELGNRDRYNALIAIEYKPSEDLHAYLDFQYGKIANHYDRSAMGWGVRTGNGSTQMIPANLKLSKQWLNSRVTNGLGGVVATGTFYNPTYSVEARDYHEFGDFVSINPGVEWQASELLKISAEVYYTKSVYWRRNPTVMVATCNSTTLNSAYASTASCTNGFPTTTGTVATIDTTGSYPKTTLNISYNDPKNFEWTTGRVNFTADSRWTTTNGAHLDVVYGGDTLSIKAGAAYDVNYRLTRSAGDIGWQNMICGGNANYPSFGSNNTSMPGCTGQASDGTSTWKPIGWTNNYTGWGTGYTTGAAALKFSGSLIPTSKLYNYLRPGADGFIAVDYDKVYRDSNYWTVLNTGRNAMKCIPHCDWLGKPGDNIATLHPASLGQQIDERGIGFYGKAVGAIDVGDHRVRYDFGLRWVEVRQALTAAGSPVTDTRNYGADGISGTSDDLADGGKYASTYNPIVTMIHKYHAFLPAFSAVYEVSDDFQLRASLSRTMTRPDPGQMGVTMTFSDPTVSGASLGNPKLAPYYSNNLDLGGELYTGGEGYLGFTYFRKSISGYPISAITKRTFSYLAQYGVTYSSLYDTQRTAYANGGTTGVSCNSDATCANQWVNVTQTINLPGLSIVDGLELNLVQPLDFLTEEYLGIKGFGFTGNVTIMDQKGTQSLTTKKMTGIPPYQYNMTLYYEDNGIMVRGSYTFMGKTYNADGSAVGNVCLTAVASGAQPTNCPDGAYMYGKEYGQFDLSSSLRLSRLFGDLPSDPELTFNITNLFNAKQRSYIQYTDAIKSYYDAGATYMVGIRGSF